MFKLALENTDGNIVNLNDGVNYVVIEFEGFNPPAASLFTSKSPNRKGSKKNGSTLDERTVIISPKITDNMKNECLELKHIYLSKDIFLDVDIDHGIVSCKAPSDSVKVDISEIV